MKWIEDEGVLILKLEPGEPVIATIEQLATERELPGAELTAIGAVNQARLGFFLPAEKRYEVRDLQENLEVVSLLGSVARTPEGPLVHAHAALGRSDFSLVGGHLFEATVSVTLEVFLSPTSRAVARRLDPRFDLKLLSLGICRENR